MIPLLTILIPTIEERSAQFELLKNKLCELAEKDNSRIVIHSWPDNKELSIGAKRQSLLESSATATEYIVFMDDDDWPADNYISAILKALESKPDCVTFNFSHYEIGTSGIKTISVSNKYDSWQEQNEGFDFTRPPFHLTVIRREIALTIGYNDLRIAEDYDYSNRLKASGLIKHEVHIPEILYHIRYTNEPVDVKYGFTRPPSAPVVPVP